MAVVCVEDMINKMNVFDVVSDNMNAGLYCTLCVNFDVQFNYCILMFQQATMLHDIA